MAAVVLGAVTITPVASIDSFGTPIVLAALINDKIPVTLAQLDGEVSRELDARKSLGDPTPADMQAFRETVLDSLIQQVLIEQAAVIQGVAVSDQDVDAEIQSYIQAAGGHDKWLAQVAADHMTEAEYRAGLKSALITLKMRVLVTASVGTTAEQVHARHILVADLATAQQVLQQLKGGADFAALAAKYSLDVTTKQTGGDLGWFSRGQLLQKTVEDAAFSLPINQYSAPVKSDLGYHIIQTLEKVSNRPIDAATRARLAEQTFETWLQSLVKAAKIVKYI
ncbi:MAG: peptidylprolyl isomerase [Aggregatilineales bacterium]